MFSEDYCLYKLVWLPGKGGGQGVVPNPELVEIFPPFEEWVVSDLYRVSPHWVGLGSQEV